MNKLSDDLIMLTSKLMLVKEKGEILKLTNELNDCIARLIDAERTVGTCSPIEKTATAILKFTHKEISNMSKTFKKEFIANGLSAHVIKRASGKNGYYYEIRYRRNGYNITASSTNLAEAKKKFLKKTETAEIEKYKINNPKNPILSNVLFFKTIAEEWFQYKKGKITEHTLFAYKSLYDRFVFPAIGLKSIKEIRTIDLDNILKQFDKPRLYEDMRTVLNSIFKYAINCGIIQHNPLALIPYKKAERTPGRALTKEELKIFFEAMKKPEYAEFRQTYYSMLYFGLRPCEADSEAHFEGDFIIARNRKRKGGKIEYKKIPVSKIIRDKIDFNKPINPTISWDRLSRGFKKIFGDESMKLYSLRHTFCTTCQMYVRQEIVDIWMGDAPERLIGRHYTHFPDEFMIAEMDKVIFEV